VKAINQPSHKEIDMKGTSEFQKAAQRYYEDSFGPGSERAERYQAMCDADYDREWNTLHELREAMKKSIINARLANHSMFSDCATEFEIVLATGEPFARVFVELDKYRIVKTAIFQYRDAGHEWYAPKDQDSNLLVEFADIFELQCPYCPSVLGRQPAGGRRPSTGGWLFY
jgi:hypothetical protein